MKSRTTKNILVLLASVIILIIISEIILRLIGREPYKLEVIDTIAEPGGRLFQRDSLLGYKNLPGEFDVTIRKKLTFHATHSKETTHRITHAIIDSALYDDKDEVWIFGGSSSYGWGINDSENYPWIMQQVLRDYKLENFCVSGYGPLHALIQFKEALKHNRKPKYVIFAYGSYQDRRSTASRGRRKFLLGPWNTFGDFKQPVAQIDDNDSLVYSIQKLEYSELPLMRVSALVHTFEKAIIKIENNTLDIHGLSKRIIQKFNKIANSNNIKFIVAGIWKDDLTKEFIEWCNSNEISAIDVSVDVLKEGFSNRPYDEHPSYKSHKIFAERLNNFLIDSVFTNSSK